MSRRRNNSISFTNLITGLIVIALAIYFFTDFNINESRESSDLLLLLNIALLGVGVLCLLNSFAGEESVFIFLRDLISAITDAPLQSFTALFFATRLHQFYLVPQVILLPIMIYGCIIGHMWRNPFINIWRLEYLGTFTSFIWALLLLLIIQVIAGICALFVDEIGVKVTSVYGSYPRYSMSHYEGESGARKNIRAVSYLILGAASMLFTLVFLQDKPYFIPGDILIMHVTRTSNAGDGKNSLKLAIDSSGMVSGDIYSAMPWLPNMRPGKKFQCKIAGYSEDKAKEILHEAMSNEIGSQPVDVSLRQSGESVHFAVALGDVRTMQELLKNDPSLVFLEIPSFIKLHSFMWQLRRSRWGG